MTQAEAALGTTWNKPVPVADEVSAPYWEGARRHELVIQRCASCGTHIHPPRVACRTCQGFELVPTVVSPTGTIHTYTITHTPFVPGYQDDVPFALVLVELDAEPGVRLQTILHDCPHDDVAIGMRVRIVFEDVRDDLTLPYAVPER